MNTEKLIEISKIIYPVNTAGYDDPDVDIEEIEKEIDELFGALKSLCRQKKLEAVEKSIRGLEGWLAKGVNKQGKPLEETQISWAQKKIANYKKYVKENTDVVPEEVSDEWQKEFYEKK